MDEFDRANERGARRRADGPAAVAARYDAKRDRVVVALTSGGEIAFPPRRAQGLERAKPSDLAVIEISPSGLGLHFPKLDADLWLPALLEGVLVRGNGWPPGSARAAARSRARRRRGPPAPTASSAGGRGRASRVVDRCN
jgi:hypothetical protein